MIVTLLFLTYARALFSVRFYGNQKNGLTKLYNRWAARIPLRNKQSKNIPKAIRVATE